MTCPLLCVVITPPSLSCVQLQACFLVADDLMDASVTRRGQPCWYKVEGISTIAVNDAFLLRSALFVFLKAHFSSKDYYVTLLHIFNEVRLPGLWACLRWGISPSFCDRNVV